MMMQRNVDQTVAPFNQHGAEYSFSDKAITNENNRGRHVSNVILTCKQRGFQDSNFV
jgi:hypothetical protein